MEHQSDLCSGFIELLNALTFDDQLLETLYRVQTLASMINSTQIGPALLDELVTPMQGKLLIFQSERLGTSDSEVQSLCYFAALSFLEIVKASFYCYPPARRQYAITCSVSEEIMQRMMSCVLMAEQYSEPPRSLILWASFLGGTAGKRMDWRQWFLNRLVKTAMELQLESWQDVKLSLLRFPWVATVHEELCKNLKDGPLSDMC
jgi:hypothetical protein